ncbi:hypothetical protein EHS13_18715 [Paenibacillus psychroresistens]|uniref:Uncharacterized protein n=1 Tax=Paenibacillus psychroresistens TaxID=1778678 RepID=A0A6B8RMJ5_9BACL|nr:hypothetical protein [Paenibacillus psychroresistens]QGQ96765.1 hypothetical protein EHS13_18715 [Paenibacillus psychroresistens]
MMDLYIKFIVGIISTYAIVILSFAIFQIRIRENDKQIAMIALCVGVTNVYFKFVVDSSYFFLAQSVVFILLLTLLRKYPLLYSTIIHVVVSVGVAVVEASITSAAFGLKLMSADSLDENIRHFISLHAVVSIIFIAISLILVKYKIGFTFVVSRFSGRSFLKKSTYVWAILLIIATSVLQVSSQQYKIYSVNGIIISVVSLLFITVLIYSFSQNKHDLVDRFGKERKLKQ